MSDLHYFCFRTAFRRNSFHRHLGSSEDSEDNPSEDGPTSGFPAGWLVPPARSCQFCDFGSQRSSHLHELMAVSCQALTPQRRLNLWHQAAADELIGGDRPLADVHQTPAFKDLRPEF